MIISVGNIAFGGRGKTPTVAAIARLLLEMGERPAILSRGYGRRVVEDGVTVVSDGHHLLADVDRAGDEPLMLARDLPGVAVLVCEQRTIAAAYARHVLGSTSLILDDGFQHRQMARDVDVVLVAPDDLKGRRAPFGRLRESVSALSRADAVIMIEGAGSRSVENSETEKDVGCLFCGKRHPTSFADCPEFSPEKAPSPFFLGSFLQKRHPTSFSNTEFSTGRHPSLLALGSKYLDPRPLDDAGGERGPLAPGARVFALAGIAGPARFTRRVTDAGYVVAGAWAPGDHYRYTRADLARLAREVRAADAAVVLTTSKDAARLRALRPLPVVVYEWPMQVTIEAMPGTAGAPAVPFATWLRGRMAASRGASGGDSGRAHRASA